jgi:hypothetical protein
VRRRLAVDRDPDSEISGAGPMDDEGDGDDLDLNAEADYVEIAELDRYDADQVSSINRYSHSLLSNHCSRSHLSVITCPHNSRSLYSSFVSSYYF